MAKLSKIRLFSKKKGTLLSGNGGDRCSVPEEKTLLVGRFGVGVSNLQRGSGSGFRVPGFGFRVSDSKSRVRRDQVSKHKGTSDTRVTVETVAVWPKKKRCWLVSGFSEMRFVEHAYRMFRLLRV